jgi:hypothetical protein
VYVLVVLLILRLRHLILHQQPEGVTAARLHSIYACLLLLLPLLVMRDTPPRTSVYKSVEE